MRAKGRGYKKASVVGVKTTFEHDVDRSEVKAKCTSFGEEEKERECGL